MTGHPDHSDQRCQLLLISISHTVAVTCVQRNLAAFACLSTQAAGHSTGYTHIACLCEVSVTTSKRYIATVLLLCIFILESFQTYSVQKWTRYNWTKEIKMRPLSILIRYIFVLIHFTFHIWQLVEKWKLHFRQSLPSPHLFSWARSIFMQRSLHTMWCCHSVFGVIRLMVFDKNVIKDVEKLKLPQLCSRHKRFAGEL